MSHPHGTIHFSNKCFHAVTLKEKKKNNNKVQKWNFKDGAYLFKDIFAPVYDYAGNVDLDKYYRNQKRKLGVTTHFSKIIHEQYL